MSWAGIGETQWNKGTCLKTVEGNTARIRELSVQNMKLIEDLDDCGLAGREEDYD